MTGRTEAKIRILLEEAVKRGDLTNCTDGSVKENQSGWGYTLQLNQPTIFEDSAAYCMKTASMTLEMGAVTHVLYWLAEKKDGQKTQAVIHTDSMSLLQKVKKGSIHSE